MEYLKKKRNFEIYVKSEWQNEIMRKQKKKREYIIDNYLGKMTDCLNKNSRKIRIKGYED